MSMCATTTSYSATTSPNLGPAYTCGSHISIIDIDDEELEGFGYISTMNPGAKEFVPGFYPIEDSSEEARRVDDIMKTMHHLASVYDTEQLMFAQRFADADYALDEREEYSLDAEDALCGSLHTRAQKPKGNTYSRKRQSRGRQSRERPGF